MHDAPRSAAQVTFRFWLHNMVPIGAAQGLTFACSNAAYMYLTITFNQMLAALTFVHQRGVVMRTLTSRRILYNPAVPSPT